MLPMCSRLGLMSTLLAIKSSELFVFPQISIVRTIKKNNQSSLVSRGNIDIRLFFFGAKKERNIDEIRFISSSLIYFNFTIQAFLAAVQPWYFE